MATSDVDPAVPTIERMLSASGTSAAHSHDRTPSATHALWICACVTDREAPTWLIYLMPDGDLAWRRVPDGVEALDLVAADRYAGGHVAPDQFLRWLRGESEEAADGGGDLSGDPSVLSEVRRAIRSA